MSRFNIRVYGLWIEGNTILVAREQIKGKEIIKFPGGGLEFGEGTLECLKREWLEELQINIEIISHFYTTDYFQPSAWDNSQVISIYYMVKPLEPLPLPFQNEREHFYKSEINEALLHQLSLPIDKLVLELLLTNKNH